MTTPRHALALLGLAALVGCSGDHVGVVDGRLVVSPASVEIGVVPLATALPIRLRLENVGDLALTLSATVTGSPAVHIVDAPARIAPGAAATLRLEVVAETIGELRAELVLLTSAAPTSLVYVPIAGRAVAETLGVDPPALDFQHTRVGATKRLPLTITNPLDEAANIALEVDAEGPFLVDGPTTARLEGGASTTIDVTFAPRAERSYVDRLRVTRTSGGIGERTIALGGRGTSSSLVCETDHLDFASVVPQRCATRATRCENVADAPMTIVGLDVTPEGPFTAQIAYRTLVPRERTSLTVEFCPTDLDTHTADVRIATREPDGQPRTTTLAMRGRGGGPALELERTSLSFGGALIGGRTQRRLTLTNVGFETLTITDVTLTPEASAFAIVEAPEAIPPDERGAVELVFSPTTLGPASGELVFRTNDASRPTVRVALTGVAIATQPCELVVAPPSLSFGVVQAGTPSTLEVSLTASGVEPCAYFDARVENGARFSVVGPTSGVVPSGGTATFAVVYAADAPSFPGGDVDAFVVDVPNASPSERRVPLHGTIAPRELLVDPSPVDFQTIATGDVRDKSVAVFNVGEEPHEIGGVVLASGSSADLSIVAIEPPAPGTLAPGDSFVVTVRYAPTVDGFDRGTLAITSDRFASPLQVSLSGRALTKPCGNVRGTICGPSGGIPSVGARVTLGAETTTTDADGRFYLHCVPPGAHALVAERGHFSRTVPVTVAEGQTTTLPASTCLDPSTVDIAVVRGRWDRVETILTQLGIPFELHEGEDTPAGILGNPALLASYDILFLNCGIDDATVRSPAVAANLRAFVEGGGALYASDLAYDAVEAAFAGAIDFAGDDAIADAAEQGTRTTVDGRVIDPRILRQLDRRTTVPLEFSSDYVLLDAVAPLTTLHVVGRTDAPSGPLRPLLVSFAPPAGGRVVYTTFHNTDAITNADMARVLEILISEL